MNKVQIIWGTAKKGRDGQLEGQKPIRWIQVSIAVMIALIIIAIIIYLSSRGESGDTRGC